MAALYFGMQGKPQKQREEKGIENRTFPKESAGILSAGVRQSAKFFVPFRSPTRQFHRSFRVWEESQTKLQDPHGIYGYQMSRPLIKRNPTKIVVYIWVGLAPVAICAFFYTKSYLEEKRLKVMKLQRKMNAARQQTKETKTASPVTEGLPETKI